MARQLTKCKSWTGFHKVWSIHWGKFEQGPIQILSTWDTEDPIMIWSRLLKYLHKSTFIEVLAWLYSLHTNNHNSWTCFLYLLVLSNPGLSEHNVPLKAWPGPWPALNYLNAFDWSIFTLLWQKFQNNSYFYSSAGGCLTTSHMWFNADTVMSCYFDTLLVNETCRPDKWQHIKLRRGRRTIGHKCPGQDV